MQFFWDRNRMCAQDRLAETIVVDVRKPKANTVTERAQSESETAISLSGMGPRDSPQLVNQKGRPTRRV